MGINNLLELSKLQKILKIPKCLIKITTPDYYCDSYCKKRKIFYLSNDKINTIKKIKLKEFKYLWEKDSLIFEYKCQCCNDIKVFGILCYKNIESSVKPINAISHISPIGPIGPYICFSYECNEDGHPLENIKDIYDQRLIENYGTLKKALIRATIYDTYNQYIMSIYNDESYNYDEIDYNEIDEDYDEIDYNEIDDIDCCYIPNLGAIEQMNIID